MRVDQIPFPITVHVRRRHILAGVCGNKQRCGITLAVKEAIARKKKGWVAVETVGGQDSIHFANSYWELREGNYLLAGLRCGARQKIKSFVGLHDSCRIKAARIKVTKPFSFVIWGVE